MQRIDAHSHIEALLSLIDIAYVLNNIPEKKIIYWTKLATDTDNALRYEIKLEQ